MRKKHDNISLTRNPNSNGQEFATILINYRVLKLHISTGVNACRILFTVLSNIIDFISMRSLFGVLKHSLHVNRKKIHYKHKNT